MAETTIGSVSVPAAPDRFAALLSGSFWPRFLTGTVILLVWEFAVRATAPTYVAKPSTVVLAIPRVITDPAFLQALGSTLTAVAEGLAITIVAGTTIGVLMGRSNIFDRAIRVYVNGFNAMPMIIVLPLFSLWFGYSGAARIATIIFAAIFAITMNVADGGRAVPREYLEVAHSFRSGRLRMLIEIVLPASMPYLLAGFRLAAGRALIGAVVAEFFLSVGGPGYYTLHSRPTTTTRLRRRAAARCVWGEFRIDGERSDPAFHAMVSPRRKRTSSRSITRNCMSSDPCLRSRSRNSLCFVVNGVVLTDFRGGHRPMSSYNDWCAWSARAAHHEQLDVRRWKKHFLTAGECLQRAGVYYTSASFPVRARPDANESGNKKQTKSASALLTCDRPVSVDIPYQGKTLVGILRNRQASNAAGRCDGGCLIPPKRKVTPTRRYFSREG